MPGSGYAATIIKGFHLIYSSLKIGIATKIKSGLPHTTRGPSIHYCSMERQYHIDNFVKNVSRYNAR